MTPENRHASPPDTADVADGEVDPDDCIFALTSVPPVMGDLPAQRSCIRSWREAGLQVRTFNHTSEIGAVRRQLDIDAVPVSDAGTSADEFGKPYVRIKTMLDWAADRNVPAILINADIELRLAPWELQRVRWLCDGGLCYFVRHNHDGDREQAAFDPHGIDAFLLHGRDANLFPPSFFSMGVPFWDYWLPHTFIQHGRPLWSVESRVTFHRRHPQQWSNDNWHRCAWEFDRLTGILGPDRSFASCDRMAHAVRRSIDARRLSLALRPMTFGDWMRDEVARAGRKTIVRVGVYQSADTDWIAASSDVTLHTFDGTTTLDAEIARSRLGAVDLVWAETSGGNGDLVRGAGQTLSRTQHLYTRYGAGETSLRRLLAMLPDFRLVELWAEHVLLENRSPAGPGGPDADRG